MTIFNHLFPLWALLLSIVAFFFHEPFSALERAIVPMLSGVMFMMGLTLDKNDFFRISKEPRPLFIGVLIQFLLMPLVALALSNVLQLSNQLTVGMVLVGSCAGGTASNVITYLAKGDVALSISMTMASTFIGVFATPLLCNFYLTETIEVDSFGMLKSLAQIVLLPVFAGVLTNHAIHHQISKYKQYLPSLSVACVLMIIAIVVALNSARLVDVGAVTLVAVIFHNTFGLIGGFFISRLIGLNIKQSQTIAIEVGMQNSGLGVALALQYFSATAALPGALFSVWHNISGSILAAIWGRKRD